MKSRFKLRTIIIIINLLTLLLPIGGVGILRIYESILIKQTEESLIAQSAFIIATYKHIFHKQFSLNNLNDYGNKLQTNEKSVVKDWGKWRPVPASINLQESTILPILQLPRPTNIKADPYALKVGAELNNILKQSQLTTLAGMTIFDANGIVVATTNFVIGNKAEQQQEVEQALKGIPNHVLRYRSTQDRNRSWISSINRATDSKIYIAHPIIISERVIAVVLLARTPPNLLQTIYQHSFEFILFMFIMLAIAMTLSAFTAYAITRPIQILAKQSKKATSGEHTELVPLENPITQEIELLSKTLVEMVKRKNLRASYVKDFAAHVSHEFKTPITAIEGSIELLVEHEESITNEERVKFFQNIKKDTKRMKSLLVQLNKLAQADHTDIPKDYTNMVPVLKSTCKRFKNDLNEIELSNSLEEILLRVEPEILDCLFSHLMANAVQHDANTVQITVTEQDNKINISFKDNGQGISKNNLSKIFDPFFTTQRKSGGTGLGLAIVKSLMESHKGKVKFQHHNSGAEFILCFNIGS